MGNFDHCLIEKFIKPIGSDIDIGRIKSYQTLKIKITYNDISEVKKLLIIESGENIAFFFGANSEASRQMKILQNWSIIVQIRQIAFGHHVEVICGPAVADIVYRRGEQYGEEFDVIKPNL